MTRRVPTTITMLAITLCLVACNASAAVHPSALEGKPELDVLAIDTSVSSTVTPDKADSVTQTMVESAIDRGATFQIWTTGSTLEDCRLVYEQKLIPVEIGTKNRRVVKRQQQVDAATTAARAIVTGALAIRPQNSLLFELVAKIMRGKPPGVTQRIVFITDMKQATKGFSMECRVPTATELARYLEVNGLLQPNASAKEVVAVTFAYVDLSTANPQCPGATLKDQYKREELWRGALEHAGVAPEAIEVLAGPIGFLRTETRRKRPRRKKQSLLSRFTGIVLPSFRDRAGTVVSLDNLPTPKELAISLHDYVISLIGPCPKHNPEEDPRLARAAQDALLTSEVDAQRRVVETLLEELADYQPGWLMVILIVLMAAAEVWATQVLLEELGVTGITSWLWSVGQVAAMVWFLETLAHKAKNWIVYVVGYGLVVAVVVAMALLRTGDLGVEAGGVVDQTSQIILLSAVVCGIPFLLSAVLGTFNRRAPVARKLSNEERKLAALEGKQVDGQTVIEGSYAAVEEWTTLYEQVRADALVQFPNYFYDAPTAKATNPVEADGGKEDEDADV